MRAHAPVATTEPGPRVVRIPPPLYFGVAFAAGLAARATQVPLSFPAAPATRTVGAAVLAAGAGLALSGIVQVVRRHTTVVPHHRRVRLGHDRPVPPLPQPDVHRLGDRLPRWRAAHRVLVAAHHLATGDGRRPRACHRPRRALPQEPFSASLCRLLPANSALALAHPGHPGTRRRSPPGHPPSSSTRAPAVVLSPGPAACS